MFLTRQTFMEELAKTLAAGQYNAAPGTLTQGSALQTEKIDNVITNVCYLDEELFLQRAIKTEPCKQTLAQFDRQLSYGNFEGNAQLEGAVGQEDDGDYVRVTVPMCYYSQVRKTTIVADTVGTVDGQSGFDRQAENAAKTIAGSLEFDSLRGMDDFSNAGVFDGNPYMISDMPNMRGLFLQVRQSDSVNLPNSHDLMFDEFGSDDSITIPVNGYLRQEHVEDARMKAQMNHSRAKQILLDPRAIAQYNKINFPLNRLVIGGSAPTATGADLKTQWTANGTAELKASRFLAGRTSPPTRFRNTAPGAPTHASASVASTTDFLAGEIYRYYVTSVNEMGQGRPSVAAPVTIAANGDKVEVTITPPAGGNVRHFNVYRSLNGGTRLRFIGSVKYNGGATEVFTDLGNKIPGFSTGVLFDDESAKFAEMMAYSRVKLGMHELAKPEAYFSFRTLKVTKPRGSILFDNLDSGYTG